MATNRHHMGMGFEVWTGNETWFWFVDDPHRDAGAIGAAASELEAVREACVLIEAIAWERHRMRPLARWASIPIPVIEWDQSLAKLERYLARVYNSRA